MILNLLLLNLIGFKCSSSDLWDDIKTGDLEIGDIDYSDFGETGISDEFHDKRWITYDGILPSSEDIQLNDFELFSNLVTEHYDKGVSNDYNNENDQNGCDIHEKGNYKKERLNDFVFVCRPDENISKEQVLNDLLKRYRVESGNQLACRIEWRMLDHVRIPEKYKDLIFNRRAIFSDLNYRNPELVENIHFRRYGSFEKMDEMSENIVIDPEDFDFPDKYKIKQELLEQFRRESRNTKARYISWKLVDMAKLPEKYHNIKLSHFTIFDKCLYKESEFLQNLHFTAYPDRYLKSLDVTSDVTSLDDVMEQSADESVNQNKKLKV